MAEERDNAGGNGQNGQRRKQFSAQIPVPAKLKIHEEGLATKWKQFLRSWKIYERASRLSEEENSYRCSVLLACIGEEALAVFDGFHFDNEADRDNIDTVILKFEEFCVGATHEAFESYKFHIRNQEGSETIDCYVAELRKLAKNCNFGDAEDRMIRDRIVVGVKCEELRKKLLADSKLTLQTAVTIARSHETSGKQALAMNTSGVDTSVDAVRQNKPKREFSKKSEHKSNKNFSHRPKCKKCGRKHDMNKCPAVNQKCFNCDSVGHFAEFCYSKSKGKRASEVKAEPQDGAYLGAVGAGGDPWRVTLDIGGQKMRCKIDTGADVTCVPGRAVDNRTLQASDQKLYGPGKNLLRVRGMYLADISVKGEKCRSEKVYVVEDLEEPLLSRPVVLGLKLIKRVDSVETLDPRRDFPKLWQGLGKVKPEAAPEYAITMKPDAKEFAVAAPRRVPVPYLKKVEEELERLKDLEVIRPVTSPTRWCAPIVVVPKEKSDAVRICVDLTKLNEGVLRENFPLPSTDQLLAQLEGAKVFSKLDCNSGFYQIPLAKESEELTTFITPFGRFCFKRLPFGISSGSEIFHRMMSQLLSDIPGVICDIDDVLIFAPDQIEHDRRLRLVLEKLEKAGITLNDKCQFNVKSIKFLGHIVTSEGIKVDPEKVEAIVKFPQPQNVADVRRLLGIANHVGKFSPNLTDVTKPLRDLLKKENSWTWDENQQEAFEKLKKVLTSAPVLQHYSTSLPTKVSADASSYGLGAVLLQQHGEDWRPVMYASRSMTPTEQRYAQVEKEALASTWACERFSDFLIGLPTFTIETDHRPLLALLHTKQLDELSPRIQRFRMRLMNYKYDVKFTAGKDLATADSLSRAPSGSAQESDIAFESDVSAFVDSIVRGLPATEDRLDEIRRKQREDRVCSEVAGHCRNGWPQQVSSPIKPYLTLKNDISLQQGLLMYRDRIIIPEKMREEILNRLHGGHQGIVKTRALAKNSVWWPGLSSEIKSKIEECPTCVKERQPPHEPLKTTPVPDRPWQKLGSDLMEWEGEDYLLVVDYFSKYIELALLKNTTSETVVGHMKSIFSRHGIPTTLVSDNATQYSSTHFAKFAERYAFSHETSSPMYPQANGEAERAVRTIKQLLAKAEDPYEALMVYRATPLQCGFSPAEKLFGRKIRTRVPITDQQLKPKFPLERMKEADRELKQVQKKHYDRRHRVQELPPLPPAAKVWIKTPKELQRGEVIEKFGNSQRSYNVQTNTGVKRRNRRDIRRRTGEANARDPAPQHSEMIQKPREDRSTIAITEDLPQDVSETPEAVADADVEERIVVDTPPARTRSGRIVRPPTRLDL